MRTRIILTLVMLMTPLLFITAEAKKKKVTTWNEVKTVYANTKYIKVTKVELTDTATTLHVHARYYPNEGIIIQTESCLQDLQGGKYAMKSAEGITPGKNFRMPATGEHDFVLRFAPLPAGTRQFDFLEGEKEGCWQLFGIHDAGTSLDLGIPEELKSMRYTDNETLPAVTFSPGKATIKCRVYGYRPAMNISMRCVYTTIGSKQQKMLDKPVNDDGTVSIEVDLDMPTMLVIGIEHVDYTHVFAVPGEEITCAIDLGKSGNPGFFGFTGRLARTHHEIANDKGNLVKMIRGCHQPMTDGMRGHNAEECAAFLNKMLKAQTDSINSCDITDATKQICRMYAEENQIGWRYDFAGKWENAIYNSRKESIKTREDYMNMLKNMDMPDIKGPIMCDFPDMECLNSDQALFNTTLLTYSGMGNNLPITNGNNRQMAMAHAYLCGATDMSEAEEATITNDHLKTMIARKRERDIQMLKALNNSDNVFFKTYDNVSPEDILPTILKKYEGKAVFVDIWATWCGPCRNGHKMMVPLKTEMKDKDVVFVYITSPSSPADTWKEMIDDIPGEHYYLTKEQYGHILSKYDSSGIPTYLLFDKNGKLTYKSIGFAGNDVFRQEIEKAMNSK